MIDCLLFTGHAVGEPELPRDFVSRIRKQWEAQLVLVAHEERLLYGLRRNCHERCACLLNLWQDEIHRFHLADAERAPAPADEAEHEASFREQVGRRDALAVVILKLEFRNRRSDRQNIRG